LWAHGWLTPLALGMITFAIASFAAFFNPARDSLVPDLVNERDLPHANALIQTSWQVAILLGPVAAAFILSATANDVNLLFVLNAATYGVSLACILVVARAVRTPLAATFATPIAPGDAADPAASTPAPPRGSVLAELREGLAFAWANPVMRIVLIVTAIDNIILMGPAIVGIPLFVREVLQAGPTSYSWIQAALAGGVIAGVPFMAVFGKRLPLGKTLMWGVVLDGLTYMPLAWITTFEGAVITVFLHSVFIPVITVTRTTLVQRHVPPRMRGRMFALIGMCVIGGTSISVALTGWAAESMSVHTIYLAISIGAAATALPGFFSKGLRDADAAAGR
ncbi:MAG: MFS transporter, partial [Planctomycetota bacterium]